MTNCALILSETFQPTIWRVNLSCKARQIAETAVPQAKVCNITRRKLRSFRLAYLPRPAKGSHKSANRVWNQSFAVWTSAVESPVNSSAAWPFEQSNVRFLSSPQSGVNRSGDSSDQNILWFARRNRFAEKFSDPHKRHKPTAEPPSPGTQLESETNSFGFQWTDSALTSPAEEQFRLF